MTQFSGFRFFLFCAVVCACGSRSSQAQVVAPVPKAGPDARHERAKQTPAVVNEAGRPTKLLSQPASAPAASQPDAAIDYSLELIEYLQRTIRNRRREIDRLKLEDTSERKQTAEETNERAKGQGKAKGRVTRRQFQKLMHRFDAAEAELAQLQAAGGNKPPAAPPKIHPLIDSPYVGVVHTGGNKMIRFFVVRLVVVNQSKEAVTIKRSDLQLAADGKTYKSGPLSRQVKSHSFQSGNRSIYLGNLKFPAEESVAAGETGSMWLVYENLPPGGNLPAMALQMQLAGKPASIDVNDHSRDVLGLTVERIGPRDCLGLLTIAGSMNAVNIGALVDELDKLTADNVIRAVIRWEKSAPVIESQISNWLQQAAHQAGRGQQNNNNRFPLVPVAIRELHLAQVPQQSSGSRSQSPYGPQAPLRIHPTDRRAIAEALRGVYEVIPRDELLREIDNGDRLARAAALEVGGGRLPSSDLPVILEYAGGPDADMQRAALIALRHFGDSAAIDTLLKHVRANQNPLASVAIESLAASRFSAAHAALLEALQQAPSGLRKKIVAILAQFPRPVWREVIYEIASTGDAQVSVAALQALSRIGHPKLLDVLDASMMREDRSVRETAFGILVSRSDARSEELAMQYALAQMKTQPPTPQVLQLVQRTRDPRALPLLIEHFRKSKSNRSALIGALSQVGDESVADVVLEQYESLATREKSQVLTMLRQFRSPRFSDLAGDALMSQDSSLVNAACRGLQEDGGDEAVALLVDAFEKTKNRSAWSYITNALSNLGTPQARDALVKGTQSEDANRRTYSINALNNLRRRSPGYQYIYMAQQYDRQKKWKEAVQQYSLAAQMDPKLPEAYSGRGNALMQQGKHAEAGKDFQKALKLDPLNSMALTGLGIVRVVEGKPEAGIELVEKNRKKFAKNPLFSYNIACVYGRALEALKKDEKAPDRDKKITEYQKQALADLEQSVKLGFRDLNWMKKDPDLKSLHGLKEFEKLHSPTDRKEEPQPATGDVDEERAIDNIAVPAVVE